MYKQNDTLVVERNLKKGWMIIGLVQTSLGSGFHHEPFFPVKAAHSIAAPASSCQELPVAVRSCQELARAASSCH